MPVVGHCARQRAGRGGAVNLISGVWIGGEFVVSSYAGAHQHMEARFHSADSNIIAVGVLTQLICFAGLQYSMCASYSYSS